MAVDTSLVMTVLAGLFTGLAFWGILYGLFTLLAGREARVRARVKQFVTDQGRPEVSVSQQRRQLRENLFSQIESRWDEQSFFRVTFRKLTNELEKADLKTTVTEFLLIQLSMSVGLALIFWLLAPNFKPLLALFGFMTGMVSVRMYLRYLGQRRVQRFEDQLADTLSVLASSVRGGFSLFQALQLISREASEPAKTEFQRVIQEVSLGSNMEEALSGLARRIPTEDVDILVTAISLQHQTGGSLAHVLEVVSHTVRERHRVERDIRAMTAQQRISAIFLAALPYILAAVLFIISPTYMSHLFQWGWVLCMPVGAVIFSIIGLMIMRKIAAIDV